MINASESHIVMIPNKLPSRHLYDTILATLLFLCTAVGFPGNLLALRFFSTRQRKELGNRLYIRICCVDLITTIAHFPATLSLVRYREPLLFLHMSVCVGWTLLFMFLQKVSMFLVLLLSVSRTIALTVPFFKINRSGVVVAFNVYVCLVMLHESLHFIWTSFKYISIGPFCTARPNPGAWSEFVSPAITATQIGLPPILTFISFMLCLIKLQKRDSDGESGGGFKRATITIAFFTGLFLVCNLPYFAMRIVFIIHQILDWDLPGPIFSPPFLHEYHLPISKILCTVLNASLNPVLYWCRMTSFRRWLTQGRRIDVTSSSSKGTKATHRYRLRILGKSSKEGATDCALVTRDTKL